MTTAHLKDSAYARAIIADLERDTQSLAARRRMAELAITIGRYDDDAKDVWREYLQRLPR